MLKRFKTLALLIFLLLFATFISYSSKALFEFYRYKEKVDKNITLTLDRFNFLLKDAIDREIIKYSAKPLLSDSQTPLKSFYITLKNRDLERLNSNLPESGKRFVNGFLRVVDSNFSRVYKVKLRYRGDSFLHWFYPQKSLRIKLKGKDVFDKARVFNLINPPHDFSIIDSVAYKIAEREGLISPKYEPARVFINGRFMGVYIYLSQVDESLLRANSKMPGSIYYGDLTPKGDLSRPAELFFNSNLWDKKGARNAQKREFRGDIELFTKIINESDDKEFKKLVKSYLNLDKFYIFFALDTLFGGFHHDYAHNHKLYFDPFKGKFEPIEWDLRYWSSSQYKDNSLYPLLLKITSIPEFEAERDRVAYKILKKYPASQIIKELESYKMLILRDLESDILRDTGKRPKEFPNGIATSFTIGEFQKSIESYKEVIRKREKILYKIFQDAKVAYKRDGSKIYLRVDGNSAIEIRKGDLKAILYPARKREKLSKNSIPFLYGNYRLTPAPRFYQLEEGNLDSIKFINYITGDKVKIKKENFKITGEIKEVSFKPIERKSDNLIVLSGDINISKELIFRDKVKIEAGTTFYLDRNSSIFFYSKVKAIGTKDKPIRFIPRDNNVIWGSIVLQGRETSGSIFKYIEIRGGSVTKRDLIEYSGEFNIHDSSDIKLSNLIIGKNHIGDDALHLAYIDGVKVENSTFKDARSDALDIDISKAEVIGCKFINSGNDALDIMTTKLFSNRNYFINSGDKGISVGEASIGEIKNSIFKKNTIGLEVKDDSIIVAKNITFIDSKRLDIHLYRKNIRYQNGGYLKIKDAKFYPDRKIELDKRSKLEWIKD